MGQEHDHENVGLRGLHAASSAICLINGHDGKLYYRGYDIRDLTKQASFEEVVHILIFKKLPNLLELKDIDSFLKSERGLPSEVIDYLSKIPKKTPPMAVLQSSCALLTASCPEFTNDSIEANRRKAMRILSKIPTIVSYWHHIRNDRKPIEPVESLPHAANFLYMLNGEEPEEAVARCFDVSLILHAEHSFNASTFTARVVASTRAHVYSAISAAVGSLSGALHGGANSRVMSNLLDIGEVDKVEEWVKSEFDKGKRIMGMGHAVYRTVDPRARILKAMAHQMLDRVGDDKWFRITNRLVEATQAEFKQRKGRDIFPNVDLYSASVYSRMGIPVDLFTPVFSISRSAGWSGHILEERFPDPPVKPVLYRPTAHYVGEYCGEEACEFIPLEERE
jgi:citrate synthase